MSGETKTTHRETTPEKTSAPSELVTCFGLQTAMSRVLPHRDASEHKVPALAGVLLDFADQHMFVVATDRYTLAVARVRTDAPASARPWQLLLEAADTDCLAEMLASMDREEPVHLSEAYLDDGGPLLSVDSRYRNTLVEGIPPHHSAAPPPGFPNWRELVSLATRKEAGGAASMPALSSHLLGTWQHLESVTFHPPRSTDARSGQASGAVVITSDDFLGLHVPYNDQRAKPDIWSSPTDWLPALSQTTA